MNKWFNLFLRGTKLMAAEGGGGEGSGGGTAADAGQQTGGENAQGAQPDAAADDAEYEAFRKKYEKRLNKDYQNVGQRAFDQRFKDRKQLEEENKAWRAFGAKAAPRWGTESIDPLELTKALDNDESYLQQKADEEGYTLKQYKQKVDRDMELYQLRAEKQERQEAEQAAIREQQRAAMVQRLEAEEARVKEVYPTFDLEKEAGNPEFVKMLKVGISMQRAFETLHMDELMQGAMQYTAAKVQQTTARNIQARQARPDEGAAAKAAPVTAKTDVNKLTKADREKIAQEVMRGKVITFS